MLSIDDIYCNRISGEYRVATELQKDIAYALCHFNEDSLKMTASMQSIRRTFMGGIGIDGDRYGGEASIFGLTTTAHAFDIRSTQAMSPSADDTRIALIIGKPISRVTQTGQKEVALQKFYAIGMRVVNKCDIYMTKVYPVEANYVAPGTNRRLNKNTLLEGQLVSSPTTCYAKVCDAVHVVGEYTQTGIDRLVEEARLQFDGLVANLHVVLGEGSPAQVPEVKRLHSLPVAPPAPVPPALTRCNAIEMEAATDDVGELLRNSSSRLSPSCFD